MSRMAEVSTLAFQHLLCRLRPVHRELRAMARRRVDELARLDRPAVRAELVSPELVALRLIDFEQTLRTGRTGVSPPPSDDDDAEVERELRVRASANGQVLPIDRLVAQLELDSFEIHALLVCVATELAGVYGDVFAFVRDDPARRFASVDVLASMSAPTLADVARRRALLSRRGRLCRVGLLAHAGNGDLVATTAAVDVLLGRYSAAFRDPLDIEAERVDGADDPRVEVIASAISKRTTTTIAIWRGTAGARRDAALRIAARAGKRLRQPWLPARPAQDPSRELASALDEACALDAMLLLDVDALSLGEQSLAIVENSAAVVVVAAQTPVRLPVLVRRGFCELELASPSLAERCEMWRAAMPELSDAKTDALAGRYRFDRQAVVASVALARAQAPEAPETALDRAAAQLAQPRSLSFADVIEPSRRFGDLVLPPGLEAQVRELAESYTVWPVVAERWGFARANALGIKALFAGDPGTGKTLAAEVIAGHLGLALVRIDLARIVSKWVGETEKNLAAAFAEAADANAVLFFDEAEALFGKRGEVRHGTDRYANLEISFLLQKLERHDGLVILASNLRDEIDPAFVRRFNYVLHFPRPGEAERRRLWRLAFPPAAPLAPDVDLAVFARLDLTGAGIAASARGAALTAARAGSSLISVVDIVAAVTQQFQREARALTATDLGPYGSVLSATLRPS
jgi:hypothetical protein